MGHVRIFNKRLAHTFYLRICFGDILFAVVSTLLPKLNGDILSYSCLCSSWVRRRCLMAF